MFLLNFTPVAHEKYRVKAPCGGTFREIINSDDEKYGGQGRVNKAPIRAKKVPTPRKKPGKENKEVKETKAAYEITCYLPPLSVVVLEYDYKK